MGRWHSIVNRKSAGDATKGKVYAKIGKIISIAARKGIDPDLNPSLALALQKAKENNLPKDVVEKAIKKWSWNTDGEELFEIYYEWYGPGWVALYIKAITTNTNRSATNIKTVVQKNGWNMWTPGSVSRQFKQLGLIVIDGISRMEKVKWKDTEMVDPYDSAKLENDAFELSIEDVEFEGDHCIITTAKENYHEVLKSVLNSGYHVMKSDLQYIPDNTVALGEEDKMRLEAIIEWLEDDDDVDFVVSNGE